MNRASGKNEKEKLLKTELSYVYIVKQSFYYLSVKLSLSMTPVHL